MHRDLEKLLETARGESHFVVVVFLDIRGFSSFARMAESSEAAIFLRRMYLEILSEYFPDHDFFKPTGDGLMIIRRFDSDTLQERLESSVKSALRLVDDFPKFCVSDPMINFEVPHNLGIGLARGAVTCLASEDKTLDYSGRPLNLAARLMDLARPAGVVFDDGFGPRLLSAELQECFAGERVFVKGLADDHPMGIFYSHLYTEIPPHAKQPLNKLVWVISAEEHVKMKDLIARPGSFLYTLQQAPAGPVQMVIECAQPTPGGRPSRNVDLEQVFGMSYDDEGGTPRAEANFEEVVEYLGEQGVKPTWPVRVTVRHQVRATE